MIGGELLGTGQPFPLPAFQPGQLGAQRSVIRRLLLVRPGRPLRRAAEEIGHTLPGVSGADRGRDGRQGQSRLFRVTLMRASPGPGGTPTWDADSRRPISATSPERDSGPVSSCSTRGVAPSCV